MPRTVLHVALALTVVGATIALACLGAGKVTGHSAREVWAGIIDATRWVWFGRRQPVLFRAFQAQGLVTYADVRAARDRGWTVETMAALRKVAIRHRQDHSFDGAYSWREPSISGAIRGTSFDAVTVFDQDGSDLGLTAPELAQVWFEAAGSLAPLAKRAGLGLDEAKSLRDQGCLDPGSLLALIALRDDKGAQRRCLPPSACRQCSEAVAWA